MTNATPKFAIAFAIGLLVILLGGFFGVRAIMRSMPAWANYRQSTPFGVVTMSYGDIDVHPLPKEVKNGLGEIDSCVKKLSASTAWSRQMVIASADKQTGFFLVRSFEHAFGTEFEFDVSLNAKRETAIRAFFEALDMRANEGSARPVNKLKYRLVSSESELTLLIQRILVEIFDVEPKDTLMIQYEEDDDA